MVGNSSRQGEGTPSSGVEGKVRRKRGWGEDSGGGGADDRDPKAAIVKASEQGRLDPVQAKALLELTSRLGILGFENERVISTMVMDIVLEDSSAKRAKLALRLKEHLEEDRLAKDLAPILSGAFALE